MLPNFQLPGEMDVSHSRKRCQPEADDISWSEMTQTEKKKKCKISENIFRAVEFIFCALFLYFRPTQTDCVCTLNVR